MRGYKQELLMIDRHTALPRVLVQAASSCCSASILCRQSLVCSPLPRSNRSHLAIDKIINILLVRNVTYLITLGVKCMSESNNIGMI